jgi:hypothetical protein
VRLQTLPNTAIGALARSTDTALMLLASIDASFDFDFNDYLHSACLCPAPRYSATARTGSIPDLLHFRVGNFLTSSVIIAFPFPEIDCERTIIQTIASFLLAHLDFESPTISDDAHILCSNTLAYHLASPNQRESLHLLFNNIALLVAAQAPTEELRLSIRRSALSPTAVRLLTEWLTNNLTDLLLASRQGTLFTAIIEQVLQHTANDAVSSLSDPRAAAMLAGYWMDGRPFSELFTVLQQRDVRIGARYIRPKVENLVEICESGFGYDGAMLVSTMADLVEPLNEELSAALFAIHKRFKYGLPSQTAVCLLRTRLCRSDRKHGAG